MKDDILVDLYYIIQYANDTSKQIRSGKVPKLGVLNRMCELSEHIRRHYDQNYEEYVDEAGHRTSK